MMLLSSSVTLLARKALKMERGYDLLAVYLCGICTRQHRRLMSYVWTVLAHLSSGSSTSVLPVLFLPISGAYEASNIFA